MSRRATVAYVIREGMERGKGRYFLHHASGIPGAIWTDSQRKAEWFWSNQPLQAKANAAMVNGRVVRVTVRASKEERALRVAEALNAELTKEVEELRSRLALPSGAANGLHPCPACDGDGFVLKTCGCREASCPHEPVFGAGTDPQPGLYQKFWVSRTDGSSRDGGKHEDCDYFVLDWTHDLFAVAAALAYARACEAEYPDLAVDLRARAAKAAGSSLSPPAPQTRRDRVREFQLATGQPALDVPTEDIPEERARLRAGLIAEEFLETMQAMFRGSIAVYHCAAAKHHLEALVENAVLGINLPKLADGLEDLDYVVEGTRQEFGVDGEPVAALVHNANMTKTTGPVLPNGKRGKPADFVAPDVGAELERQGWKRPPAPAFVVVEAPGDWCVGSGRLPDGSPCPGCRACR